MKRQWLLERDIIEEVVRPWLLSKGIPIIRGEGKLEHAFWIDSERVEPDHLAEGLCQAIYAWCLANLIEIQSDSRESLNKRGM